MFWLFGREEEEKEEMVFINEHAGETDREAQ